jgi:prepilin-type N-terminal cleavage/methylation domain-containing protein/prepilin-type processing-associated H-X9-DG protein
VKKTFTLIELIIVVAIIGILISILLPSLAKARAKVRLAVCLSNTKQITSANMMHHKIFGRLVKNGYLNGGPNLAEQTFSYNDGNTKRVVPFTGAINKIMGDNKIDFSSHSALETYLKDINNFPTFQCPDKKEYPTGYISAHGRYIRGATAYVGSDAAMGKENGKPRANGLLELFDEPSKIFLHMDGERRKVGNAWFAIYNNKKELTMSDAFRGNQSGHLSNFALTRHYGRTAVTFADGHSKSVASNSKAMEEVYLSKGIALP